MAPDAPDTPSPPPGPESPHRLEQQRRVNRDAVAALGFNPYGQRRDGLVSLAHARGLYDEQADAAHQAASKAPPPGYTDRRPVVSIAGRAVLHRDNGKLVWLGLRDDTGDLQVAASMKDCDERSFALAKSLDLGDLVIATGPILRTRTGEVTVWARTIEPASKCLMPPPEKHAGLHDVEQRYRRRYVDLWATPETMRIFRTRSRLLARLRRFLDERAYLEVETPVLQQLAGGAAARPFITSMNALGIDLYLRIAPELYLKRLLVGGMPRVYELSRNFRNEGIDKQHNPEFTMLEVYHAYGDVETMMQLTESLVRELARLAVLEAEDAGGGAPAPENAIPGNGALVLPFGDLMIDYGPPFARIAYGDLFEKALGFAMTDSRRIRDEAKRRHLLDESKGAPANVLIVNELFEKFAEPTLDPARPTFITDYPASISPLTRPKPSDPALADRADLFIGGMELAPHYTELNDPDVQEAKFREQLAGIDAGETTFRTFDQDFIDALKVGMPPAGGMGVGIDRLMMLLTNQRSIRDVLLFPMMRPQG